MSQRIIVPIALITLLCGAGYAAYFFREEKVSTVTKPPTTETGTINGKAMLGPTCPVMRIPPDPGCSDKPYQGKLELTNTSGIFVSQFLTDANGNFTLNALPGTYTINSPRETMLPRCTSQAFQVISGEKVDISVSCDTGIR